MKHILKYCKNPYWKFIKGEKHLHAYCIDYMVENYPQILTIHCPNEGKRTPYEQYEAKVLGVTEGIPDILICRGVGKYHGLAIELKHGRNGLTDAQKDCLHKLTTEGWLISVCYDLDTFKLTVSNYLNNKL